MLYLLHPYNIFLFACSLYKDWNERSRLIILRLFLINLWANKMMQIRILNLLEDSRLYTVLLAYLTYKFIFYEYFFVSCFINFLLYHLFVIHFILSFINHLLEVIKFSIHQLLYWVNFPNFHLLSLDRFLVPKCLLLILNHQTH